MSFVYRGFRSMPLLALATFAALGVTRSTASAGQVAPSPSVVRVVQENGTWHLTRNGAPFLIKGAGGDGSMALLQKVGGNSFRTWGADNLGPQLDEAEKLGLSVTVGMWLGHRDQGFDYNSADQVSEQYERARQAILKYKDHPALLMWAIGNEMEGKGDDAAVWEAVNSIAALAKRLDPNHPTMTVIAEIGGDKVKNINRLCPDVDIVGINSYGGGPSIAQRYRAAGGTKPYVITEYGPAGVWESGKNAWGVALELSSTEKAARYRATYKGSIEGQPLCLGGYAFIWGHKQEATATWFGLLLPDGSRLGGVDALHELWTGRPPANRCPEIASLKVAGQDQVAPGASVRVDLAAADPDGDPLTVKWILQADPAAHGAGGQMEATPPTYPEAITASDLKHAQLTMPKYGGGYRLFAYVYDNHGAAAVANVPMLVQGGEKEPLATAKTATLPLVVYGEAGKAGAPYAPSGYMGNTGAIKMDEACAISPHSGKTCLQVQYQAPDNWGGVVWQDPPNDWGDHAGGRNLTGATRLSFWARGEKGGEVVTFLVGIIARDKTYYDTATAKADRVSLTQEWKEYSIDLKGKDLSRIKTGFGWTLSVSGSPVTFYLDDIRYE